MRSLRVRLLLILGVAIALAAALQFAASFQAALRQANKLFDYHMEQMALALQDSDFSQVDWSALSGQQLEGFDFVIQVWGKDGVQVYQSRPFRFLPPRTELGYSNVLLENGEWRVYAVRHKQRLLQVAQKLEARRARATVLALSTLWPVIPVSLVLFIAAWWGVTAVLAPVNRIGDELAERNADSLAPVSAAGAPSEVSRLVTELNSLLARMVQALQAQQRFVADAAHELRSPITALKLQVQTLARSKDEQAVAQGIARLQGGVDRASRLVEQLLLLARQDPAAHQAGAAPGNAVSLTRCVEQALADVAPLAQSRHIMLHYPHLPELQVLGDEESLRVMIRNVLDNAVRYIPEQGSVAVSLQASSSGARLTVEDSGPGIPAPERERIFDRFYRLPGTSASGSGLGLAIVKTIADRHKAQITLAQAELGGLSFSVQFPPA
jgi:two-component system OmpR family sensor kinase